jgi:hypothetical protein
MPQGDRPLTSLIQIALAYDLQLSAHVDASLASIDAQLR